DRAYHRPPVGGLQSALGWLSDVLWGDALGVPLLVPLLAAVGLYLTIGLRALPWRRLPHAFALLWRGRRAEAGDAGEISPFQALMTALSATVGTGNIAGV